MMLVMIRVNIAEVKAELSKYLAKVEAGETVVVCRRNEPIAELRPIRRPLREKRPVGLGPRFDVPTSFFEPLPDDLVAAFGGEK